MTSSAHDSPQAPATSVTSVTTSVTTIEIHKEYLHFSCAHFTLFSATERENLHGHNFQIGCEVEAAVDETGLCFDYNIIKDVLKTLCAEIDEQMLLPGNSPWLTVERQAGQDGQSDMVLALFNGEKIPFLARDVTVLPLRNITVEELAGWMLQRIVNTPEVKNLPLTKMLVRVASGNDQWARSNWEA